MSFADISNAAGPGADLRYANRGRIPNSTLSIQYPSPFFDVAQTWLPTTIKALFRWCRYYFMTNGFLNAAISKLAEYPITDIVIEHESKQTVDKWTEFLQDQLRYRSFQVEFGLDYHVYGNGAMSIQYPFRKMLQCVRCKLVDSAKNLRPHWVFSGNAFRLTCPRCGLTEEAAARDEYIKDASGIRLMRWNIEDIDGRYHDLTGNTTYTYNIPASIRGDIGIGNKDVVENIPQIFIQATKEQKSIIFSQENFFHMKRPSLADQDRVYGLPLMLPLLKDAFQLQLMNKAQEAILLEHIIPLRFLFPQAASGSSDPFTTINLSTWKDHIAREIARWRMDPNYIPILPLPVGMQTMGGDGRSLLLTQDIQQMHERLLVGASVPKEFLFGGMSYAGTNVSMRMLENQFLGYILRHRAMLRFVIREIGAYLGWPIPKSKFKQFKMADDMQRKAFLAALNDKNKISDTTLLADSDLDQSNENDIMEREADARIRVSRKIQLGMADIQGQSMAVASKYQVKAQQDAMQAQQEGAAPGEPGAPNAPAAAGDPQQAQQAPAAPPDQGGAPDPTAYIQDAQSKLTQGGAGLDINALAWQQAQLLAGMPDTNRAAGLANLQAYSPELAEMVIKMLANMGVSTSGGSDGAQQSNGVDMRPLPEQRSPRRATAAV